MKRIALLTTLCLPLATFAVTDNPDGSVTFTQEEAQNLLENFQRMASENKQYEVDQERALQIFKRMQNEIDKLEKEKKEMKCS